MLRLRVPQLVYAADELTVKPKDDDDQMMGMKSRELKKMGKLGGQLLGAQIDWNLYIKKYDAVPREQLVKTIADKLLQIPSGVTEETLKKHTDASTRENFIKTATIQLMSTPEYQLC
jgi:hypothetical protein